MSLAEAGVEANALAESGNERDLAKLRAAWADELEALSNEPEVGPVWATEATRSYLFLRAASIYGGTNEIMKEVIGRAI